MISALKAFRVCRQENTFPDHALPLGAVSPSAISSTDALDLLITACATLPKSSLSPAIRSTRNTTRSASLERISCRIASSGAVWARSAVLTSTL